MFHTRVTRWLLFGICVLVASCSGGAATREASAPAAQKHTAPADPIAAERPKIVILGDSLTAGYGLLESAAYPFLLQQKLDQDGYNFEIVNAGVSGDTSAGGLRRLDWALENGVRVLILELGANDGLRGVPVTDLTENLTTIIQRAREKNV